MLSGYLLQLFHIVFDRKLVELTGIDHFFGYAVGINNKLQRYSRSTYYQRKRISKLPTRNFLQIFLMTYYDRAILFNTIDVVLECKILEFYVVLTRRHLLSLFNF